MAPAILKQLGVKRGPWERMRAKEWRRKLERRLLGSLLPDDLAILETAWLLPVNITDTGEPILVSEIDAAASTSQKRVEYPVRPDLDTKLSVRANAKAAKDFYDKLRIALEKETKKLRGKESS